MKITTFPHFNGLAAISCVARNSSCSILDGFGKIIALGSFVLVAEAIAISEACVFCLKAGLSQVCVESNNSTMVSWCIGVECLPPWEIRYIFEDIKELAFSAVLSFVSTRILAN